MCIRVCFKEERLEQVQNLGECVYKKGDVEDPGEKMSKQHSEDPENAGGVIFMKKELSVIILTKGKAGGVICKFIYRHLKNLE